MVKFLVTVFKCKRFFKNRYHCIALSLKDSRKEIQSYEKQYKDGKKL